MAVAVENASRKTGEVRGRRGGREVRIEAVDEPLNVAVLMLKPRGCDSDERLVGADRLRSGSCRLKTAGRPSRFMIGNPVLT